MNKKEKFALFLGMLSGDGCLSIKHNGQGRRNYPVHFCNTEKEKVILFAQLFFDLFGVEGKVHSNKRENKRILWEFLKHSKEIVEKLRATGFPEGVKRDILRVPSLIWQGSDNEKAAFVYGFIITDGSVRKNGGVLFHSGSKLFLEDLSVLFQDFAIDKKEVKHFIQRDKYDSYQLSLNKEEAKIIISKMPTWDNGTPPVLSI